MQRRKENRTEERGWRGRERTRRRAASHTCHLLCSEQRSHRAWYFSHCGFSVTMGSKKAFFKKELLFSIYSRTSSSKQQNEIVPCYLSPQKETAHTREGDNSHLAFICLIKCIVQACKIYGTGQTYGVQEGAVPGSSCLLGR